MDFSVNKSETELDALNIPSLSNMANDAKVHKNLPGKG